MLYKQTHAFRYHYSVATLENKAFNAHKSSLVVLSAGEEMLNPPAYKMRGLEGPSRDGQHEGEGSDGCISLPSKR